MISFEVGQNALKRNVYVLIVMTCTILKYLSEETQAEE